MDTTLYALDTVSHYFFNPLLNPSLPDLTFPKGFETHRVLTSVDQGRHCTSSSVLLPTKQRIRWQP